MFPARFPFLAACTAVLALAGCGVGIGIEISDDDDPPSVSVSASLAQATPGQAVRLSAQASDDYFVDEVRFYRIESDGRSTLLCTDRSPGYDCNTQVPGSAAIGSAVNFFARAWDSAGHSTDSGTVTVTVVATGTPGTPASSP